jgi:hypothetical protein
MKKIQALIVLALAIGIVAPASAAQSDPEVIIYRFPGVTDDGGASSVGVATVFHCTNFSGTQEIIRLVTRSTIGDLVNNSPFLVRHLQTQMIATHSVNAYVTAPLGTGKVEGTTAIAATSTNVICTAMTIDAAAQKPVGVASRGIRFSPVPGSQE